MLILNAAQIDSQILMPSVIERMREAFSRRYVTPPRQVIGIPGGQTDRLCLVMPCFDPSGSGAIKLSTVFPDNQTQGIPTIQGTLVVFSETGTPTAILDGGAVTRIRTAAASALASGYLSRANSTTLLIVGTGELAPYMALAHCASRPIDCVYVWGRREASAQATATALRAKLGSHIQVLVAGSLKEAVAEADIISCATSSSEPVLLGQWLEPGTFIDLVGSFSPSKREADDEAILRSRVFVDTYDGAYAEAGDLLDPWNRKVIGKAHILGELSELVCGRILGRTGDDEITLFKSVGTAMEDYALAQLLIENAGVQRA